MPNSQLFFDKRGRNIHNNTRQYDPLLWHQNNQIVCVCTQSCLTVCNPMSCGSPGFSVHVISQARIVNGLPFPSPGDLPNPGIKSGSPALQAGSLLSEPPGKSLLNVAHLLQNKTPLSEFTFKRKPKLFVKLFK